MAKLPQKLYLNEEASREYVEANEKKKREEVEAAWQQREWELAAMSHKTRAEWRELTKVDAREVLENHWLFEE